MVVAVFDSGFGGLSLLYEAMKKLEGCDFIYFADNENAPYGTKSIDEIKALSIDAVDFLASKADIIVIACNTATSAAVSDLRQKFNIPIIGMEPAVNLGKDADGDILVIATPATIKGAKLNELLKKSNLNNKTHLLPMPKLVEFAQNMESLKTEDKIYEYAFNIRRDESDKNITIKQIETGKEKEKIEISNKLK